MSTAPGTIRQELSIRLGYSVLFTRNLLDANNPALFQALSGNSVEPRASRRGAVFVDAGVEKAWPGLADRLVARVQAWADGAKVGPVHVVPGGEAIKNDPDRIFGFAREMLECGLCRHSRVVLVGGGAVLDALGFAASLVHRGLRVVRVPTTVLAQNDAGLGVKNGINLDGVKNAIGSFHIPHSVLIDFDFLDTLPDREWRGGAAEAWKVALLKDLDLFDWLCRQAGALRRRERGPMETLVRRCAEAHLGHIAGGGDPFELGSARPLDFGHWSAHALESMSGFRIGHGEAVAAGVALDTAYAVLSGWVPASDLDRLFCGLLECGLPVWYPEMAAATANGTPCLFQGIEAFREHLGGRLTLTFPEGPGTSRDETEVDMARMQAALERVRRAAIP